MKPAADIPSSSRGKPTRIQQVKVFSAVSDVQSRVISEKIELDELGLGLRID